MAKKNWFIEANKSQDPEVKALLEQYNALDANADDYESKKADLVLNIKDKLGLIDEQPTNETEPETPEVKAEMDAVADKVVAAESDTDSIDAELGDQETPETSNVAENANDDSEKDNSQDEPTDEAEPEMPEGFYYTEADAAKAKDLDTLIQLKKACREEIQRLEKTRLKHGTYKQNRELDAAIWKIRRIIGIAFKREIALKERARRIRNAGRVSSIALKRARFVKLMRQGFSITNITKHPEGVKKEELTQVLDADTIEACRKNNSRFPDMWKRWKEKFIDNKPNNK
ncbi:MAG: hypothetical protein IJQ55_05400 [Alphaproteobacteria bacterium]|nr:hypothetical protein [Alphaproteobacteria bacterium]